jgi:hypothetical protein
VVLTGQTVASLARCAADSPTVNASYLTPKARPLIVDGRGTGSVAIEPIAAGETVAAFGGPCVTRTQLDAMDADRRHRSIQIDDELYLAGPIDVEDADCINHSCEPNCVMGGSVVLVARRDIAVGEEITYDYATSDGSDYDEFECSCGSELCRGKVTGHDWMLPELQLRYRGQFSPYLARRISALVATGAERRAFAF